MKFIFKKNPCFNLNCKSSATPLRVRNFFYPLPVFMRGSNFTSITLFFFRCKPLTQKSLRSDFSIVFKGKALTIRQCCTDEKKEQSVRRSTLLKDFFKCESKSWSTASFYTRTKKLIDLIYKKQILQRVLKMLNDSYREYNNKSCFPSWKLNFEPERRHHRLLSSDNNRRPLPDLKEEDRIYWDEMKKVQVDLISTFHKGMSFFFLPLYFFGRPYTRKHKYRRWLKIVKIANRYAYDTSYFKKLYPPIRLKSSEKKYLHQVWSNKIPDVYLAVAIKALGTPFKFKRLTQVERVNKFKQIRNLVSFSNPLSLSRIFDEYLREQKRRKKRFRTINKKMVGPSTKFSGGLEYYLLLRKTIVNTILESDNNQDKSRTFCDILKLLSKSCKKIFYAKIKFSLQRSVSAKLPRNMQLGKWYDLRFIKSFLKTPLSYRQPDKEFKKLLEKIFAAVLKCSQLQGKVQKKNDATESITLADINFEDSNVSPSGVQWIKREFSPSFIPPYIEGHVDYRATPEERKEAKKLALLNKDKIPLRKGTFEEFSQVKADNLRYGIANCIFSLVLNFTKDKILGSVPACEVELKNFLLNSFDYTEVTANNISIGEILSKEIKILERSSTNKNKEILKMVDIFDGAETFSFQLAEMAINLFIKKDFFLVCNKSFFNDKNAIKTRKFLLFAEPILMDYCHSDVGLPEFVQAKKIQFADQVEIIPRKDGGFDNFELSVSAIEAINYSNSLEFSINENFVKLIAKILYETDQVPIVMVSSKKNSLVDTDPCLDDSFLKRIGPNNFFFFSIAQKTINTDNYWVKPFLPFANVIDLKHSASTIDQIENDLEEIRNNSNQTQYELEGYTKPLFEKLRKEEKNFDKLRKDLAKLYAQVNLALSIKGYPIYFQNKLDFRGRMYPVNTLFSRTSGYAKHFVSGQIRKMTPAGFFYLASLLYGFSNRPHKHINKIKKELNCGLPLESFTAFLQRYVMNHPLTSREQSANGLYCELVKLELFMSCHSKTSSFLIEIDQKASAATFLGFLFNNSKLLNNTCLKLDKNKGSNLMRYFRKNIHKIFPLAVKDLISQSSKKGLGFFFCKETEREANEPLTFSQLRKDLHLIWLFFTGERSHKVHKKAFMEFIFGQNSSTLGDIWVEDFNLEIQRLAEEKINYLDKRGKLSNDAKREKMLKRKNQYIAVFKRQQKVFEYCLRFMAKRYSSFLASVLNNLPLQVKKLKKICDFLLRELGYVSYETLDGCKCKWYATTNVAHKKPSSYIEKVINVNTVYDFSNSTSTERSRYNFKVHSNLRSKIASKSGKVPPVNKERSSFTFLVNLIHSVDASVVRIVILKLKSKNIFVSHNHDSFLVSPIHVDELYNTLEEVYSNEVWNELTLEKMYFDLNRKELMKLYPKSSTKYEVKLAEYDSLVQDFQKTYTLDRNDSEIVKDLSIRSCYVLEH